MSITFIHTSGCKDYQSPLLEVLESECEYGVLSGSIEPIEGGDNPEIDW